MRAIAATSRRRSSNCVLLTATPKYCPMTSSISCASSKMTAEYSGMICAELFVFQSEIGEEQVVIDDDDVALERALMHQGEKAALELLALLPGAHIAARVEFRPDGTVFREVVGFPRDRRSPWFFPTRG